MNNNEMLRKINKHENKDIPELREQLDNNTNKINRSYYLDEYKKNNDISYLEAFNRIISEIPEGYGCLLYTSDAADE